MGCGMVVHFRVILDRNLTPCSLLSVRYSLPAQCPLIAHSFPDAIDLQVPALMVTDGLWNGGAFQGHSGQESHPMLMAHCPIFITHSVPTHRPLITRWVSPDLQVPPLMVTDGLWNGGAFQGHSGQESHPLLIAQCLIFTTRSVPTHRPLITHWVSPDLQVPPLMVMDGLWNGGAFQGHVGQESHPLLIAQCPIFTTHSVPTHRPLISRCH